MSGVACSDLLEMHARAEGPEGSENHQQIEVDDEAEVGGHLWKAGWTLQTFHQKVLEETLQGASDCLW